MWKVNYIHVKTSTKYVWFYYSTVHQQITINILLYLAQLPKKGL